ncbi:MAG: amidohydrolase family protein [Salinivirgaceae bacterium]|nr:amidohydrolase family protein [Salinivirgaceae bacterium]
MRKIAATYVFPVTSPPIKYGIVTLNDNDEVVHIKDNGGVMIEEEGCEYYSGILIPGLVNAHTHLELSYLKNYVQPHSGMLEFLDKMIMRSASDQTTLDDAISFADSKMYAQGVSVVGDICNGSSTVNTKSKSKISYYSFIELLGLNKSDSDHRFQKGVALFNQFRSASLSVSIVPHAPYSVHGDLLSHIALHPESEVVSVHMLESEHASENVSNDKRSFKHFFKAKNILREDYNQTNNPVEFILDRFKNKQVLLVHNIHATPKDWDYVQAIAKRNALSIFAVTCPRSNEFIHAVLPNYDCWPTEIPVCIGTDSLASNADLSVFNEMVFLKEKTNLSFETLLKWATINGAKALKMDQRFGSIEVGKTPGLNLISGIDYSKMKITESSSIRRIC